MPLGRFGGAGFGVVGGSGVRHPRLGCWGVVVSVSVVVVVVVSIFTLLVSWC